MYNIRKGSLIGISFKELYGEAILLKDLPLNMVRKIPTKLIFKIGEIIHTSQEIEKVFMMEGNTVYIQTIGDDEYFITPTFTDVQENLVLCA